MFRALGFRSFFTDTQLQLERNSLKWRWLFDGGLISHFKRNSLKRRWLIDGGLISHFKRNSLKWRRLIDGGLVILSWQSWSLVYICSRRKRSDILFSKVRKELSIQGEGSREFITRSFESMNVKPRVVHVHVAPVSGALLFLILYCLSKARRWQRSHSTGWCLLAPPLPVLALGACKV